VSASSGGFRTGTTRRGAAARVVAMPAVAALSMLVACAPTFTDAAQAASVGKPPGFPVRAPRSCVGRQEAAHRGEYGVAQARALFVDRSRPTPADPTRGLPSAPSRTLPVVIDYPISVPPTSRRGIPTGVRPAAGQFPLVIVAHGVTSDGPVMAGLALPWAQAGYVVAAPTFPRSSGAGAGDSDLPQQPKDVRFLISSLAQYFSQRSDPLFGHVLTRCVAVAGHSGGAATALSVGYESGVADRRIKAVVSISGIVVPLTGGSYRDPPKTPLLLIHGDADTAVPIAASQRAFSELPVPRIFVTMHGAGHVSIFLPPAGQVVNDAVIDFLNATLRGDRSAITTLRRQVARSSDASMKVAA
jgi:predicted dienelactone hydrolase